MATPDKKNIQGDIWPRLPKKFETFYFFRITHVDRFKNHLAKLVPLITTADDAFKMREDLYSKKANGTLAGLIKLSAVNVSFSSKGLAKLNAEGFSDEVFNNGQYQDMTYPEAGQDPKKHQGLDDQHDWYHHFKPRNGWIDGVFIVVGDSAATVKRTIDRLIEGIFEVGKGGQSLQRVCSQSGHVLDDDREHFGWVDGLSQPVVIGLDDLGKKKNPEGMKPIPAGTILVGGDQDTSTTPAWAKDGSFMVYRIYEQRVPEFISWCASNIERIKIDKGFSDQAKKELRLFSSRVMGRWPDGAPLELHPTDDPSVVLDHEPNENVRKLKEKWGADFDKNWKEQEVRNHTDNFNYNADDQTKCPYASHIRKCGPRDDHPFYHKHLMLRRGIPYGDLTLTPEKEGGVSQVERGLLFVSYQSSIQNGFRTVQKEWANKADGPDDKSEECGGLPQGIDPIIGQVPPHRRDDDEVTMYKSPAPLVNLPDPMFPPPKENTKTVGINRFIIPRGGEYFFSPSISGMKDHLCKA
nr:dye-decolorizing heme-containing peroxidase [Penicillium camemberti]